MACIDCSCQAKLASASLWAQVRSSEARAPISPQQRKATQAAPTLRLKLRQSQAALSTPGSDEDPSRVRPRMLSLTQRL